MKISHLALAALVLSALSCKERAPIDTKNIPASVQEIQTALSESWGLADPLTMAKGDYLYQETTQKIDSMDPRLTLQEGITISDRKETDSEIDYTYLYQTQYWVGNDQKTSTEEDHRAVSKPKSTSTTDTTSSTTTTTPSTDPAVQAVQKNFVHTKDATAADATQHMTLGFEHLVNLAYSCQNSDALTKYCKEELALDSCTVQCANLTVSSEVRPAPALIKSQANCGGLLNCQLNIKNVSFDLNFSQTKNNVVTTTKATYTVALSPDMPFLSRMMDYCVRGMVKAPTSSQYYLATVCTTVQNFIRGAN
jgi:hypothetical protein